MKRNTWVLVVAALAMLTAIASAAVPAQKAAASSSAKTTTTVAKGAASATPKIDLNRATVAELTGLPGIGKAIADKIVAARPFKSKRELRTKRLVTAREYTAISGRVMVKTEAAPAAKAHG